MRLLFLQDHRETDRFFEASGVQLPKTDCDQFHFRRVAFSTHLKSRVGNILVTADSIRITLNLDGTPIVSQTHTHPSHSQTSRLSTSSLSLGVPDTRRVDSSGLVFSLSSHRLSYVGLVLTSRFIDS